MLEQVLMAGGMVLAVLFATFLIWLSRQGRPTEAGKDRAFRARALTKSIPKLREIANRRSRDPVGREAQIFLYNWTAELEPQSRKMRGGQREKFLAGLYYTRIFPILEEYERLQSQTRRSA